MQFRLFSIQKSNYSKLNLIFKNIFIFLLFYRIFDEMLFTIRRQSVTIQTEVYAIWKQSVRKAQNKPSAYGLCNGANKSV